VKCSADATWTDAPGTNESLPINCITWYEAFAFCTWDGGRLPTEVEWEYAASGGSYNRNYPWGNVPAPNNTDASYAVYYCLGDGSAPGACAFSDILPVGSKPPGAGRFGQLDLAGSVWEKTLDWFAPFPSSLPDNYAKTDMGTNRVNRGGCWGDYSTNLNTSVRGNSPPTNRADTDGVRCARDVK
jgi:formylglycine-generating enzyme required for sulfatase activity